MTSRISLSQAFSQWRELAADIPSHDAPAHAESWNDYTDSLCKDGELCELQYHYAPAWDEPMPGEGSRFDPLSEDRAFILERMGVTMSAVFVPFSRSRNAKEKTPSLNWKITLKRGAREIIETDYMQGCAHAPAYEKPVLFCPSGKRDEYATKRAIAAECETGKTARGGAVPAPDLADVMYSLLQDARALDSADFADWCAEYGYNSDSIRDRASYDACMATAAKLRAAFGQKPLSDLYDLFEDM